MFRSIISLTAVLLMAASISFAQANTDDALKRSLEGRQVLTKIDLPASDQGVDIIVDKTAATVDEHKHQRLIKESGIAIAKGSRARITGIRYGNGSIQVELDGGGSPSLEWVVAGVTLNEPAPVAKSPRELDLERQLSGETSTVSVSYLRGDLDYERQRRQRQDERNRQAYDDAMRLRDKYILEHRKEWGSKLNIVIRTKESMPLRDLVKMVSKYVELLPREAPTQ